MTPIHQRFPSAHRVLAGAAAAALLATLAMPVALADPPAVPPTAQVSGAPTADPNLAQTVRSDEKIIPAGTPVVVAKGHIDIGPLIVDDKLGLLFRDDRVSPPVWRYLSDAVFVLGDQARQTIPHQGDYSFTGAQPGQSVWVVPQNQVAGVPWIGWSTQAPSITSLVDLGMTFTFSDHTGPGQASLFVQSGGFSAPQVLYRSAQHKPQSLFVDLHSHTHLNWVFTSKGAHTITVRVSGKTKTGRQVSAASRLVFAVGIDPDQARSAASALPAASSPKAQPASGSTRPSPAPVEAAKAQDAPSHSTMGWIIGLIVAVAVVAAAIYGAVTRSRRTKNQVLSGGARKDT